MSEPQPAFPEPSVSTQPRPVAADAGPRPEKAASPARRTPQMASPPNVSGSVATAAKPATRKPAARTAASTPAAPKKPTAAATKPKKTPAAKAKPKASGATPASSKAGAKTSTRPSAESGTSAKPRSRGAASATGGRARAPRRKTAAWPAPQPQATPAERAAAAQTQPASERRAPVTRVAPKAPAPVAKTTPPVAPKPPVAPAPVAKATPPVAPAAPEPPVTPAAIAPVAKATPPAKPAPPIAPTPPIAPVAPVAHEIPEPVDPAPQAEMAPLAPSDEISVPLTAWVPPTPPVAPTAELVAEAPVAPEPPVAPQEPAASEHPVAPEQPPAAPAPQPISLAGADVPAMLLPQWQPTPPVEPAPEATPDPAPALAPAPEAAAEQGVAATNDHEPASKAPPGFTHSTIRAAESPTLLALDDPADDETTAPAVVSKREANVGGSAILSAVASVLPRRGDRHAFGADRAATIRLSVSVLVTAVLLAVVGPPAARAIAGLPGIGAMFDQLDSFRLYPGAYGLPWVAAVLGTLSIAGIVVAQMEKTADRFDRRKDPVTRLNIGLAGVLSLALSGAALTAFSSNGWAAAGASVAFFLSACLLVPAAALPGARAMAHQPERAWALLSIVSLVGLVIFPSLPLLAILLLAFTRVRTHWAAVSRGDDLYRDGPIDGTNRLSAILITMFVLLAASIGMNAMTLSADEIRAADVESTPAVPGTERGPTIAPPTP